MRILLFLFLLSPIVATAQFKIYMQGVVGQYSMKDMKEVQKDFETDFESGAVPAKSVTQFPMSLQFEMGADKIITDNNLAVGGYFNYALTKGRVDYTDYSGQTYADQNVSRIVIGGKAAKLLDYGFTLYAKAGFNYSMLTIEFVSTINGVGSDKESVDFYSIGVSLEPGGSWTYTVGKFGFNASAGFELNFQGETVLEEDSNAYLQTSDGEKAIINWSGVRMGLGVSYKLN